MKLEVRGDKELIRKPKKLGDRRKIRKVMRRGINAAAQEVVKGVRKQWPTDEGVSRRAVTKKVIKTRDGFMGIIGVDKNADAEGRTAPSNIDHLMEFGWQTPGGRTVPAVAPLRKGYEASSTAAMARFRQKAAQDIEKEATK